MFLYKYQDLELGKNCLLGKLIATKTGEYVFKHTKPHYHNVRDNI